MNWRTAGKVCRAVYDFAADGTGSLKRLREEDRVGAFAATCADSRWLGSDGRTRTFVRGIKRRGSEPAVPAEAAPFAETPSNMEQHGTGANGRRLALVGGIDRDRIVLRSVAAAALGFIEAGMVEEAASILRGFLRSE